jgi:hypothetical protein
MSFSSDVPYNTWIVALGSLSLHQEPICPWEVIIQLHRLSLSDQDHRVWRLLPFRLAAIFVCSTISFRRRGDFVISEVFVEPLVLGFVRNLRWGFLEIARSISRLICHQFQD